MSVEYILLMSMFVILLMSSIIKGPTTAFLKAGPLLGARVERHLITGDGFRPGARLNVWAGK